MRICLLYLRVTYREERKMKGKMHLYDDSHWQEASEYGSFAEKKLCVMKRAKKTILVRLTENLHMAEHPHVTIEQHFILDGE